MSAVTNKDTILAYNSGVKQYFDLSPQKVNNHVKDWLDSALDGLPKTVKIFEIGSGTGKDADYIEKLGYDMRLTDASTGFVEFLKNKGKKAELFDALNDTFPDNLDLVIADAVLLHFTELELKKVLSKIFNSLKTGGRFAFSVKEGEGEFTESKKLGKDRYFHLWQVRELEPILKSAGFKITYKDISKDNRANWPAWILLVVERQEQK